MSVRQSSLTSRATQALGDRLLPLQTSPHMLLVLPDGSPQRIHYIGSRDKAPAVRDQVWAFGGEYLRELRLEEDNSNVLILEPVNGAEHPSSLDGLAIFSVAYLHDAIRTRTTPPLQSYVNRPGMYRGVQYHARHSANNTNGPNFENSANQGAQTAVSPRVGVSSAKAQTASPIYARVDAASTMVQSPSAAYSKAASGTSESAALAVNGGGSPVHPDSRLIPGELLSPVKKLPAQRPLPSKISVVVNDTPKPARSIFGRTLDMVSSPFKRSREVTDAGPDPKRLAIRGTEILGKESTKDDLLNSPSKITKESVMHSESLGEKAPIQKTATAAPITIQHVQTPKADEPVLTHDRVNPNSTESARIQQQVTAKLTETAKRQMSLSPQKSPRTSSVQAQALVQSQSQSPIQSQRALIADQALDTTQEPVSLLEMIGAEIRRVTQTALATSPFSTSDTATVARAISDDRFKKVSRKVSLGLLIRFIDARVSVDQLQEYVQVVTKKISSMSGKELSSLTQGGRDLTSYFDLLDLETSHTLDFTPTATFATGSRPSSLPSSTPVPSKALAQTEAVPHTQSAQSVESTQASQSAQSILLSPSNEPTQSVSQGQPSQFVEACQPIEPQPPLVPELRLASGPGAGLRSAGAKRNSRGSYVQAGRVVRNHFDPKEDESLRRFVRSLPPRIRGSVASYVPMEEVFKTLGGLPRHSAESWRKRAMKSGMIDDIAEEERSSTAGSTVQPKRIVGVTNARMQSDDNVQAKNQENAQKIHENSQAMAQEKALPNDQAKAQAMTQAQSQAMAQAQSQARAQAQAQARAQVQAQVRTQAQAQTRTQSKDQARTQSKTQERAQAMAQSMVRSMAPLLSPVPVAEPGAVQSTIRARAATNVKERNVEKTLPKAKGRAKTAVQNGGHDNAQKKGPAFTPVNSPRNRTKTNGKRPASIGDDLLFSDMGGVRLAVASDDEIEVTAMTSKDINLAAMTTPSTTAKSSSKQHLAVTSDGPSPPQPDLAETEPAPLPNHLTLKDCAVYSNASLEVVVKHIMAKYSVAMDDVISQMSVCQMDLGRVDYYFHKQRTQL